jgi:hypothetical protein
MGRFCWFSLLAKPFAKTKERRPFRRLLELETLGERIVPSTLQNFDGPGTPYTVDRIGLNPKPTIYSGGPTGNFLRVAVVGSTNNHNTVAFDRTDAGTFSYIMAEGDFRITKTNKGKQRGNGMSLAVVDTSIYGTTGKVAPPLYAEEPNYLGQSVGIGFDRFLNADVGDISDDSISVHYAGAVVEQVDLTSGPLESNGSKFFHAQMVIRAGDGFSDVTVIITPSGQAPVTVVDHLALPGLIPFEGRVVVGARSFDSSADQDVDNIVATFSNSPAHLDFSPAIYRVLEEGGNAAVTIQRTGTTDGTASVAYSTQDGTGKAGVNYTATSGTLSFASGETSKTIQVPILNNNLVEGDRTFQIVLSSVTGAAVAGDPATITIDDDDSGRWRTVGSLPIVAIHEAMLPTGQILMWDRAGSTYLWNPVTETAVRAAEPFPDYDTYSSGHTFLADGRLLVAGGHNDPAGASSHDGEGVANASIYDPYTNTWAGIPAMNAGRWSPTATTLANGDVLVLSGSEDNSFTKNMLAEVWQPRLGTWRDLTGAQDSAPLGVDLNPRVFLAPDGRVFKVGPDQDTWFLDTSGAGAWTSGPSSNYGLRTGGSAVMYAPGKILILGGGDPPTATAEVIDLNDAVPTWKSVAPMAFARRQFNATLLPDGRVLVTGGTNGAGFNDETSAVLPAEIWDPATETFTTLSSMQVPRLYQSTALLLPDGRVLVAGGGQGGGGTDHADEQNYSPAYLFQGVRPSINSTPSTANYGSTFFVGTPDAANISKVTLVRLGSVTHGFDEDQRFVSLNFSAGTNGLTVTAPAGGAIAPPGQYLLFILDGKGVPSMGTVIQVAENGVAITQDGGTAVTEGGASDTYTIVLTSQPTADVTITLTPDAQVQVSSPTVTFSSTTWNVPQTITISAVDDNKVEGKHYGTVHHTASSADPNYDGIAIANVTATITDNDFVDLVGRNSATGDLQVALSNGTGFTSSTWGALPAGNWVDSVSGDFNGDGLTDLAARNLDTGEVWVSLSNNGSFTTSKWGTWATSIHWVDVRAGDFDGDGKDDLVARVQENGAVFVALSTGSSFVQGSSWQYYWSTKVNWVDVLVGDFNGDHKADLVARVKENGAVFVSLSTGSAFAQQTSWQYYWSTKVDWVDVRVADFNGDGISDLVARVKQNGAVFVSLSTGSTFEQQTSWQYYWSTKATWVDVQVGDFNGDGKADLVARVKENGAVFVSLSTGSGFVNQSLWDLWSTQVNWDDVRVGDFNGDGKADLVGRQDETGDLYVSTSGGDHFTQTLWGNWPPMVTWVDVFAGNVG